MAPDETFPDLAPAAPAPRRWRLVAFTGRAVGAVLVIGALSLFSRETKRPADPPAPAPASVTTTDLGIAFVPAMTLNARPVAPAAGTGRLRLDRAGEPVRIEPPRNPQEQTLASGDFSAIEETHLRLTLTRDAAEPQPGLFVTLARRAAEGPNLAVVRTGARGRVATKFGAVETLEATLSGDRRRICTGFVTLEARPVRVDGWLCAPLGQPPEPRALACALDGLALDGRADPAIDAVFTEAEARRDPACDPIRALSAQDLAGRTGSIAPRRTTPPPKRPRA
ncbi:hypothetical protein FV226_14075 [Methylobacterium sp. WL12]|uniref:hypothetical protein n=1 Tax=Methylobacterium sp. WL12 TaxID=2603890 RepID=UPI0011CABF10|nr:hypothetical protein [Methylobacterium sp. WL12]TXM71761.1 hypothetical protein FV226_14075 [Methylobacterium sp. WL12]